MNSYNLSLWIYNLALVPIVFFSILFMLLTFMNFLEKKEKKPYRKLAEVPFVTVQIPTYNDPVSERCVKKCLEFDYPKDKYEIIIADDSTNQETRQKLGAFAKIRWEYILFFQIQPAVTISRWVSVPGSTAPPDRITYF